MVLALTACAGSGAPEIADPSGVDPPTAAALQSKAPAASDPADPASQAASAEPTSTAAPSREDTGPLVAPPDTEAAAGAPPPAAAEANTTGPSLAYPNQVFELDADVLLNKSPVGRTVIRVTQAGAAFMPRDAALTLLKETLTLEDPFAGRSLATYGDGDVALADLAGAQWSMGFNTGSLAVEITAETEIVRGRTIGLGGLADPDPADYMAPQPWAAGVSFALNQGYDNSPETIEWDPVEVDTRGFLNAGGFEGVNFAYNLLFAEGPTNTVQRKEMLLFTDDYETAIRYGVGDTRPLVTGLQTSPRIGGLAIERRYDDLRPFANIRQSGSTRFTLDRASVVAVEVNRVIIRRLQLPPGTYDLRDFPFIEGGNDVRIFAEDASGREEIAEFSLFSDYEILGAGISEFAVNAGFEEKPDEGGDIKYSRNAPIASAFLNYGLTDSFNLGANLQANEDQQVAGSRVVVATPLGSALIDTVVSTNSDENRGMATSIDYQYLFERVEVGDAAGELEVDVSYDLFSNGFAAFGEEPDDDTVLDEFAVRLQSDIIAPVDLSLTGDITRYHDDRPHEKRLDLTLSTSVGALTLNGTTSLIDRGDEEDIGAFLSLSYRFGARDSVRFTGDSIEDRVRAEYERYETGAVGALSGRVGFDKSDMDRIIDGEVRYTANRVEGVVTQVSTWDESDNLSSDTLFSVRSGFGITPKDFAVGREAGEGFSMLRVHPSLQDTRVNVTNQSTTEVAGRRDGLGPILVPTERPYTPDRLAISVDGEPEGYYLGAAEFEILPGAVTGYDFIIGSAASRTVKGTLVDAGGEPLALVVGSVITLESELDDGDPRREPRPFFTNRNGFFFVEKLAAGRYRIDLRKRRGSFEFEVDVESQGLTDLGKIRVQN